MPNIIAFTPLETGCAYAISEKGRAPTGDDASQALSTADHRQSLYVAPVQFRVHLTSAFDKIQWSDRSMGYSLWRIELAGMNLNRSMFGTRMYTHTSKHATKGARRVVLCGPWLDLAGCCLSFLAGDFVFSDGLLLERLGSIFGVVNGAPRRERVSLGWRQRGLHLSLRLGPAQRVLGRKRRNDDILRWEHRGQSGALFLVGVFRTSASKSRKHPLQTPVADCKASNLEADTR